MPAKNKYKIGDKCKVLKVRDGNRECVGLVGVVTNIDYADVRLDFSACGVTDRHKTWWYHISEVEPYTEETKITKASQLKVGDTIRVDEVFYPDRAISQARKTVGLTGRVVEICRCGYVGIEFDKNIEEHSCNGNGKNGHCLYVAIEDDLKEQYQKCYSVSLVRLNNATKKVEKSNQNPSQKPIDVSELNKIIEKGYTWLAKDQDGQMFVYKAKPKLDIGGKQWYLDNGDYADCKTFKGFSVGKKKLDFYWGVPVALADIVANIKEYLV